MSATIAHERLLADQNKELDTWAVFRGRNLLRFIISSWPKVVQQFVGLSVFNTYATYFCMLSLSQKLISRADRDKSNTPGTRIPSL